MDPPAGHPHLWDKMAEYLKGLAASLAETPRAVLVISGHWENPVAVVHRGAKHTLLFDYYGFPEHTYRLTYPAPGSPEVAARVKELLPEIGVEDRRGLDHGVFVPFKLIYPDAKMPIVQLSLEENLNAERHLEIGRALAPLRDEGVLMVGSGMSYHNLRYFFVDDPRVSGPAEEFDQWLGEAVADAGTREEKLARWSEAPGAMLCHPRPEHLLPLMVAAGAAQGEAAVREYHEALLGKPVAGFRFG